MNKKNILRLGMKRVLLSSFFLGIAACGGGTGSGFSGNEGDGEGGNEGGSSFVGGVSLHNAGVPCGLCHDPISSQFIGENAFKTGGTIFKTLHAVDNSQQVAPSVSVRLESTTIPSTVLARSFAARGTGNFIINLTLTGNFIAVVQDAQGKELHRSGVHTPDRNNCNRCHTVSGTNGAPGRIVDTTAVLNTTPLPTPTANVVSFQADVFPLLNDALSCNQSACHASNAPIKPFVTTNDAAATFAAITNLGYIVSGAATNSLLFNKPADATVGHAGGLALTGTGAASVRDWINQGAKNN